MADPSLPVAIYLAELPDAAWSDLEAVAEDLLSRFRGLSRAELERGIAISLEIARARTAETRTGRQQAIAKVLAESGVAAAATHVASEWTEHAAFFPGAGRAPA
ncbi:hypothetical protein [Enterovirga sp. CN4-39]|uniref:hypothetical protein n=1 Tax=Enterovirga sp. CN4-39 TaxID=3400910 RepID=UPI003C0C941C